MPIKKPQQDKLEILGIGGLCAAIIDGESQRAIARRLRIGAMTLIDWIARDPVRSARVREARHQSADSYADKAEDVLLKADDPVKMPQARELASHYRWMASKRRPAEYGDKTTISGDAENPITVVVRPQLSKIEWMEAHGVGAATRPAE